MRFAANIGIVPDLRKMALIVLIGKSRLVDLVVLAGLLLVGAGSIWAWFGAR